MRQANKSGLFNGNALIVDNGKITYKAAIGYADASKQIPLTVKHRFFIGSIAKEFDAVAIMILQEQKKLSIDDKVDKYFPELPAWASTISIKNLLQYASGLPDINWKTVHNDDDNWKNLQALQKLDFEPGSSYAYNNNNTFLRRRIIEKVSGIPFNQFVIEKIVRPIGIRHAVMDPTESEPLMAKAFNNNFKQDPLIIPISGWTCLNLDDFYKWSECINRFCIINPVSTKQILVPIESGKQSGLGGGEMTDNKMISHIHDGTALHYQAILSSHTVKGRTIILLTNQKQNNLHELTDKIESILDANAQ